MENRDFDPNKDVEFRDVTSDEADVLRNFLAGIPGLAETIVKMYEERMKSEEKSVDEEAIEKAEAKRKFRYGRNKQVLTPVYHDFGKRTFMAEPVNPLELEKEHEV